MYLSLIILRVGNTVTGGDVITYWGIATSFARGNYPAVLPWQPNYLTVYHAGAFLVQGAIQSLSSVNISISLINVIESRELDVPVLIVIPDSLK